ncbi:unnamed protein product, partial [Laminaria digitata]
SGERNTPRPTATPGRDPTASPAGKPPERTPGVALPPETTPAPSHRSTDGEQDARSRTATPILPEAVAPRTRSPTGGSRGAPFAPTASPDRVPSASPTSAPTGEMSGEALSLEPTPTPSLRYTDGNENAPSRTTAPSPPGAVVPPTRTPVEGLRGGVFSSAPTATPSSAGEAAKRVTPSPTAVVQRPYPTTSPTSTPTEGDSGGPPSLEPTLAPSKLGVAGEQDSLSPTVAPTSIQATVTPTWSPIAGTRGGPKREPTAGATAAPTGYETESPSGGLTAEPDERVLLSVAPTSSPSNVSEADERDLPIPGTAPDKATTETPTRTPTGLSQGEAAPPPSAGDTTGDLQTPSPTVAQGSARTTLTPTSEPTEHSVGGEASPAPIWVLLAKDESSDMATPGPTATPGRASTASPTSMPTGDMSDVAMSPALTPTPSVRNTDGDQGVPSWTASPTSPGAVVRPTRGPMEEPRGGVFSSAPTASPSRAGETAKRVTPSPTAVVQGPYPTTTPTSGPTYGTPGGAISVEPTLAPSKPGVAGEEGSTSPTVVPASIQVAVTPTGGPIAGTRDGPRPEPTAGPTAVPTGYETVPPSVSLAAEPDQRVLRSVAPTSSPSNQSDADDRNLPIPGTAPDMATIETPTSTPTGSSQGEATPPPSVGVATGELRTPSPTGTPDSARATTQSPTTGSGDAHAKSTAPTGSPTQGSAREFPPTSDDGLSTAAPTSLGGSQWVWWAQVGGEGDDTGHALVQGVAENADNMYLVGAEESTVDSTCERERETNSSEARRWRQRRRLQAGTGRDVFIASFSVDGEKQWDQTFGSDGDDFALCSAAGEEEIVVGGYTTGGLYSDDNAGLDDAFLAFVDPGGGTVTGGWQFGGTTSERLYALRVDEETGDVIVGGYTTGALFATNEGASSQFVMARLNRTELLLSPGLLNLSEESGGAVVWGWQNYSATANPEAIVSLVVDSTSGIATALGVRGLPPESSPRDAEYVLENGEDSSSSVVMSLDLDDGELLWSSDDLDGVGMAISVDGASGDVYVAGFTSSEEGVDTVVVRKLDGTTGATSWTYEATSEGVSEGRAFAIDLVGDSTIVVAGFTGGSADSPQVDAFTLLLDTSDGSEKCYYQIGTGSNDVISDVLVGEAEEGSLYPGVTIAGYTEGSLAGPNAGGTDLFALGLDMDLICGDPGEDLDDIAMQRGTLAAGAASVMTGIAIVGAVVSAAVASSGAAAAAAAAAAGAGAEAGVGIAGAGAGAGAGTGATVQEASAGGVGALVTILSAGKGADRFGSPPPIGESTFRSPSAAIGFLLMAQLQFLATLSLVPSVGDSESLLSAFVNNLRWVNLWLPVFSGPLAESCDFSDSDASDDSSVGGSVFVGNTVLVLGLLLVVLFVHVVIISAVEAYWLAQNRATAAVTAARDLYGVAAVDL